MMQRRRGCRSVTLLVAVALGAASALMSIQARPEQRKTEVTEDAASLYYYPPRVSFEALGNLEDKVLAAFEEEGMLLVDGVDDYRRTRENALLELERCVVRAQQHTSEEGGWEEDAIRVSNFGDGTKRYTIASSSSSQTGRDPSCLASTPEIATLRSMNERVTKKVCETFQNALNKKLFEDSEGCGARHAGHVNMKDAVDSGEHLEHFHVYHKEGGDEEEEKEKEKNVETKTKSPKSLEKSEKHTLDMHTDLGVLLSMTPALYMKTGEILIREGSGLFVETREGEVRQVLLPDDGILFMLGEGVNMWLDGGFEFHIPKHAMRMPDEEASASTTDRKHPITRAWYGRMVLPPASARLQTGDPIDSMTYADFQNVARRKLEGVSDDGDMELVKKLEKVSCSHGRSLKEGLDVQGHEDEDSCGKGEIYCWMQCMPTDKLNCSASDAQCANSEGKIWKKETAQMCPDCQLRCIEKPSAKYKVCNPNFTPVSMYMSGFQFGYDPDGPCLVYIFRSIVLDTEWKFVLACIATALFAVLADFCGPERTRIQKKIISCERRSFAVLYEVFGVALFTGQAFLSYILMLIAMTYKGELFLSLLVGLAAGYFIFKRKSAVSNPELCCNLTLGSSERDGGDKEMQTDNLKSGSPHSCCEEPNGEKDVEIEGSMKLLSAKDRISSHQRISSDSSMG